MKCPHCGSTYFNVLLDLSKSNAPNQELTENDIVSCDNCKEEYTLGELIDEEEPVEGN